MILMEILYMTHGFALAVKSIMKLTMKNMIIALLAVRGLIGVIRMAWNRHSDNKYGSKKIEVDGIIFDSKKEAKRYSELLLLEKAGEISNLQRQVKYVLIPAQYAEVNGKRKCIERECTYISDFTYIENGKLIVEDVKGYRDPSSAGYAKFVIKRKLMLHVHGIRISEV